jgi:hypothetical protein
VYIFEVRNLMKRIIDLGIELSYSITTCIKDECNEKHDSPDSLRYSWRTVLCFMLGNWCCRMFGSILVKRLRVRLRTVFAQYILMTTHSIRRL